MDIDIIDMLQTIADPVSGTNFKYRYEKGLLIERDERFHCSFKDKRMAKFYFETLKHIDHTECTLEQRKLIEYKTLGRIVEVEKLGIRENQIEYYQVPHREVWVWDLVFITSIKRIIDQQIGMVH
jgi:hypothetical protein